MSKSSVINLFYHPKMAYLNFDSESKSMFKCKPLYDNYLSKDSRFKLNAFNKLQKDSYLLAHTKDYANNILNQSNTFSESVEYQCSSLYSSIESSITTPEIIGVSPSAGFHHAMPDQGMGFCVFSGQVIASTLIYKNYKLSGSYIDLDAHYGNSIEDSRKMFPILNTYIPKLANINPTGKNSKYIQNFKDKLDILSKLIKTDKIHYIVYCHGADSIITDNMHAGKLTEYNWFKCTEIFCDWLYNLEKELNKSIPLSVSLFGGYRDNINEICELHYKDICLMLNHFKIKNKI